MDGIREHRDVLAVPPLEDSAPHIGKPPTSVAGLPGVLKAFEFGLRDMGPLRTARLFLSANQFDGFDCPSCAWPDPDGHRQVFEFCENGAKAFAEEATTKRITRDFFQAHSVEELSRQSDHWLGHQGRLTEPMILPEGKVHYEPISWDDAFALIARELRGLASPNEATFYTSGRTSNEAAFLYQLFARRFGTNNLPDCSNMCHESSGAALNQTLGAGKATVRLDELESTDCIVLIGINPATNMPRMLSSLAKAVDNGAKIIAINPLPEAGLFRFKHPQEIRGILGPGVALASHFLQVRINGDVAVLKGLMKHLIEKDRSGGGVIDFKFIKSYCSGFDEFLSALDSVSWADIVEQSGVSEAKIRESGDVIANAKSTIVCWAMGLTQHENGVANIRELVNLVLLQGNIGRPNAGLFCVRGHSNVQGDRTMGIWEKPSREFLDRLEHEFNFSPPREHGFDVVGSINAMADGRVRVFVGLGGNFLSAAPDTEFTAAAMRNCSLTVQISTKLNRGHLVTGRTALILPCLGRTERDGDQFVTTENTTCQVRASYGKLEPASASLRSEVAIVAGLADAALGAASGIDWLGLASDYDRIRDHIEHVVPGFEQFNKRIRQTGGFYLDVAPRRREFRTPDKKAQFTVNSLPANEVEQGRFVMMTIRSHDQFNTTVYSLDDRYRGIHGGRRVLFMNPDDITAAGLQDGQVVDITSYFNGIERHAPAFRLVSFPVTPGCTASYYPEANILVPIDSLARTSGTPSSKFVVISVRPI
jgi:molybdopterin-dependent oxidoreductase alpha subunit